jgi:hypothetical protein
MKTRIVWSAILLATLGSWQGQAEERVPLDKSYEPVANAALDSTAIDQQLKQKAAAIEQSNSFRQRRPSGFDSRMLLPIQPGNDIGGEIDYPGSERATTIPAGAGSLPRRTSPGGKLEIHLYDEPATAKQSVPAKTYSRYEEKHPKMQVHNPARVEEAPPAPELQRGRFQVVIVGFEVNRQTRDDLLENDGRGDEVFLHCAVHQQTATGISAQFPRTAQMGDINRGGLLRLAAGTAGAGGGLVSGNDVGTRRLATDFPADGFRAFRLPLLVFDGELTEDQGAVLIAPSVWEWDDFGLAPGTGGDFRFGDFHVDPTAEQNRAARYEAGFAAGRRPEVIRARLADALAERPAPGSRPTVGVVRGYPFAIGDCGGNRPIGMSDVEGEWVWQPQVLGLNYFTADMISRSEFDGPRGVVSIRYRDGESLQGDYTLHLQVRRIE